ncbi:hypothetical protein NC652_038622 [Populus alba x Populus x berolinensis]|nr:hypothetical protein NC652_038622 [Populus alba x Populus x berolinensis]
MLLSRDFFSKTAHHTLYKISTTRLIEDLFAFIHAQQCCGGLPSKQLGCNNSCKLLLPNLSTLRTVESTISSSYGDVSWL